MIRLLTSGLIVFGVLAAVAGLSIAQFSDSVTIDNSTFATGTVDLQIAANIEGDPGSDLDDGPGGFNSLITGPSVTGLLPSESSTFEFWLRNSTTDGIVNLDISTLLAVDPTTHADLNENLLAGFTCDTDGGGFGGGDAATPFQKLSAWTGLTVFSPPLSLAPAAQVHCRMTATLDTDATASGGATAQFDTTFTGITPP